MMRPLLLLAVTFIPMAFEARRSQVNERALIRLGAREPPDDVFQAMRIVYPLSFLAMALEAWIRPRGGAWPVIAGALVFVGAKALKYWAIASLGPRWSFRVLVPPRSSLIATGPYRYMRHPNYVGVAGELAGVALMAGAPIAGTTAFICFGALLIARMRVENRALSGGLF